MLNCLYFLNHLISPPIYSPSTSFPNNPKYRKLSKCPPAQSIFYGLQKENNGNNTISPSTNEQSTHYAYIIKNEWQQNEAIKYKPRDFSTIGNLFVPIIPASFPSKKFLIDTNKKLPTFKKGDYISVYCANALLGRGTFHSQGKRYFIWHDAEGNERFQMKHSLMTITKL